MRPAHTSPQELQALSGDPSGLIMANRYEKMERWLRACTLHDVMVQFEGMGLRSNQATWPGAGRAVLHAANQRDHIRVDLPPPIASAIGQEVLPVFRRLRELYRRLLGKSNELYQQVVNAKFPK
jgi:hypothetical protein